MKLWFLVGAFIAGFGAAWSWQGSRAEAHYLDRETEIQDNYVTAVDLLNADYSRRLGLWQSQVTDISAERVTFQEEISELRSRSPRIITKTEIREITSEGECRCPLLADDQWVLEWNTAVAIATRPSAAGSDRSDAGRADTLRTAIDPGQFYLRGTERYDLGLSYSEYGCFRPVATRSAGADSVDSGGSQQ